MKKQATPTLSRVQSAVAYSLGRLSLTMLDAQDLAKAMAKKSITKEVLCKQFTSLQVELAAQRNIWKKASTGTTKRPRGYRPPVFPAPYESLVPKDDPQATAEAQTDLNYCATVDMLNAVSRLLVDVSASTLSGKAVLISDSCGDVFRVGFPLGKSYKDLEKDYKECLDFAIKEDPDNFQSVLVFAGMAVKGYACEGPMEMLDWSYRDWSRTLK